MPRLLRSWSSARKPSPLTSPTSSIRRKVIIALPLPSLPCATACSSFCSPTTPTKSNRPNLPRNAVSNSTYQELIPTVPNRPAKLRHFPDALMILKDYTYLKEITYANHDSCTCSQSHH